MRTARFTTVGTEPSLTTGMGTDIVSTEKTAADATASSTVVAGIDLGDEQLAAVVRGGLSDVEELLVSELSDGEDFLTEAALHLARAGGKRFRPLFTILTAQLGPVPNDPSIITAATVTELVHLATLYHDDVMDEASMRRGAPSANARWGNSVAILAGDYLFAHASRLVSTLGPEAVRIIAETFAELVTGQMRETIGVKKEQDPVEHYLKVVWEKTGSLIAASGRFGGTFSGADAAHIERLERWVMPSAPRSRSPTTSSTSRPYRRSPARRPAPTCARVSTPCPSCTRSAKKGPTQIACGSCSRARLPKMPW